MREKRWSGSGPQSPRRAPAPAAWPHRVPPGSAAPAAAALARPPGGAVPTPCSAAGKARKAEEGAGWSGEEGLRSARRLLDMISLLCARNTQDGEGRGGGGHTCQTRAVSLASLSWASCSCASSSPATFAVSSRCAARCISSSCLHAPARRGTRRSRTGLEVGKGGGEGEGGRAGRPGLVLGDHVHAELLPLELLRL